MWITDGYRRHKPDDIHGMGCETGEPVGGGEIAETNSGHFRNMLELQRYFDLADLILHMMSVSYIKHLK
jgi:hypothetical protein